MAELKYNFASIRALLNKGFTDQQLRDLCFDVRFLRPVYEELAANTGKAEIVSKILEHADRHKQI